MPPHPTPTPTGLGLQRNGAGRILLTLPIGPSLCWNSPFPREETFVQRREQTTQWHQVYTGGAGPPSSLCLVPKHWHHHKEKPLYQPGSHSPLPLLQFLPPYPHKPQAISHQLPVHSPLPILEASQRWRHTINGLLCLAAVTEHRAHARGSTNQHFFPFPG